MKAWLSTMLSYPFHCRESRCRDHPKHGINLRPSAGSYPEVSSHSGEHTINPNTHSLDWSIPMVTPEERSGSMEFSINGDDVGVFFPVKVSFVGQGSIVGIRAATVSLAENNETVTFSEDATVSVDSYLVV